MTTPGFFAIDTYRTRTTELPHGVEYQSVVCYRLLPDEPRGAHTRTFSSIARTEEQAVHWVVRQVEAWEGEMRGEEQS